ncbi:MAG: glycosyltransferase family 39 protein [Candidatus Bathyarchaeia archaeon]
MNTRAITSRIEPLVPAFILVVLAAPVIPAYEALLFDETWYVPAARRFLDSHVYERVEHPPLGQLLISAGILLLGDNPRGWRTPSLAFAAASLILTYYVAGELSKRRIVALTSSMLLASEKLFFTFSTIGVLDMFFIAFSLLSVYAALKGRVIPSALALAAGLCCKLTAVLFLPVILLILFIGKSKNPETSMGEKILAAAKWLVLTVASFLVFLYLFDGLYSAADGAEEAVIRNPIRHVSHMVGIHTSGNWPSGYGEPPWTWIIQPRNYYLGGVSLIGNGPFETLNPFIYGLTFIAMPHSLWSSIRTRDPKSTLSWAWFTSTYVIWIPLYFVVQRPLFSFYLLPAIPIMCSTAASFLNGDRRTQCLFAVLNLTFFLLFQYPMRMVISGM